MKHFFTILILAAAMVFLAPGAQAQCSVCTKTASQLGEKPAKALNQGILYLMAAPFCIVGVVGYRWWKSNKQYEDNEAAGKLPPQ
ncbi:hypothetical protein [Ferruginibacter sp.]